MSAYPGFNEKAAVLPIVQPRAAKRIEFRHMIEKSPDLMAWVGIIVVVTVLVSALYFSLTYLR